MAQFQLQISSSSGYKSPLWDNKKTAFISIEEFEVILFLMLLGSLLLSPIK